jgi:hypothetical protein
MDETAPSIVTRAPSAAERDRRCEHVRACVRVLDTIRGSDVQRVAVVAVEADVVQEMPFAIVRGDVGERRTAVED